MNKKFSKNLKKLINEDNSDLYFEIALNFIEKRNFFNNHTKLTIQALKTKKSNNYWNLKGWDAIRKYYLEVYKKYIQSTEHSSFEKLFNIEINFYTKYWKELSPSTQQLMLIFFKELDKNPDILNIPEDS
jgi:hypothetical protein